ncbi:MAG: LacI family transcriptional regulator [Rhodoferax sp.]|uniref:LacI family transcriptional regulator n=1 Tax=Rhodoferax sp. TaxID=50421 RepID=UPI00261C4F81|nr:LacI family transcriptional regulator [Rhodoferax sp.]MDD2883320.1 LacI family transcriptional regulator [Rhodoferax sp.]
MAKNDRGMVTGDPVTYQIPAPAGGVQMETFIPWTLVKRGVRRQVITPIDAPEHFEKEAVVERSARKQVKVSPSVRALGLAHYWQRLLDEGKYRSLTDIAATEGVDLSQASRTAQLTRLAPEIVESCFSDRLGAPKLEQLARVSLAGTWADQSSLIRNKPQGR